MKSDLTSKISIFRSAISRSSEQVTSPHDVFFFKVEKKTYNTHDIDGSSKGNAPTQDRTMDLSLPEQDGSQVLGERSATEP
jgi:hypothetical protein